MPVKAPVAPVVAPYSWTGFYVGANGGYGWNDSSATETPGDPASAFVSPGPFGPTVIPQASTSFNPKGAFGGVQAGYNWQFDRNWVAGIETDFQGADIKGDSTTLLNSSNIANFFNLNTSQKVEWFGTLRARLGYLPVSSLLLYATGGLAYGKVNESASLGIASPGFITSITVLPFGWNCTTATGPGAVGFGGPTCFTGSHSRTSVGWTAGAGAEYAVGNNITLKVEYLYVNLGSDSFTANAVTVPAPAPTPSFLNVNFGDAAFNLVRAGLNYRF